MNRQQVESLLILAGVGIFLLGLGVGSLVLPLLTTNQIAILIVVLVVLLLGVGWGVGRIWQAYVLDIRRLSDELRLMLTANPSHRIQLTKLPDLQRLTERINTFADRLQQALTEGEGQAQQARASLEEEKNRLTALISDLAEGVLVCDPEGRILLYNHHARELLRWQELSINGVGGFVGLGRSVFALLDRNTITHALEDLIYRIEKQRTHLVAQFVTTATNGQLLRVRMVPVLTQAQAINGFIMTLTDVTQQSEASQHRDKLLQLLTEGVRASLANIRAAIETMEAYTEMDAAKVGQLRRVIYDESLTLSTRLNQVTREYDAVLKANWQLEEMLGGDLLWAVQRRLEERLGLRVMLESQEAALWLKVDSHAIVQAMSFLAEQVQRTFQVREVTLRLKQLGQLGAFDLAWASDLNETDQLWSWQNEEFMAHGTGQPATLQEIAERHGGEVWCQTDATQQVAYFRLLLPTTQPRPVSKLPEIAGGRPEYYDFDLFDQPGLPSEMDHRPLAELVYTVFDTETTGINPSGGDEIISLSAVRIVNRRLLRQEVFDQLVDPRRPLTPDSIQIHHIVPDMLKGQPTIEQVLPVFARFAEGTVLVAHNAAFDMRLLQLKEARTGIKFVNPVLDTLLLAAVVQPNHELHSLEAIAQRLGVTVLGRHTSLGDALVTGEIFLKLIPLLAEQGIVTLGEARLAAQKSYYARLSY